MDSERRGDAVGGGFPTVDFDPPGLAKAAVDLLDPEQLLLEISWVASAWTASAMGPAVDFPAGDKRFDDPIWRLNPVYNWLGQSYLAWSEAVLRLADSPRLDRMRRERARYLARIL